jgi:hypothetical protein
MGETWFIDQLPPLMVRLGLLCSDKNDLDTLTQIVIQGAADDDSLTETQSLRLSLMNA